MGRSACVNRTWRRAAEVCLPGVINQHWLVGADGETLWMHNIVTGHEQVVELNYNGLCGSAVGQEGQHPSEWMRVLCSFMGLLLICLGEKYGFALILGDPLLNKWIKLPRPNWTSIFSSFRKAKHLSLAGFCSDSCTLMVSDEYGYFTATFDLETAEWKVDPPPRPPLHYAEVYHPTSQVCCLDGVFYSAFAKRSDLKAWTIACYDPVEHREWRHVKVSELPLPHPIFLAESHDKMLVLMAPGDHFELFEAKSSSSSGDLEIVPSPIMDDEQVSSRLRCRVTWRLSYNVRTNERHPGVYGKDGMFIWDDFVVARKLKVLSVQDNMLKDLKKHSRSNSRSSGSRCYYAPAPGTNELLASLDNKIRSRLRFQN